MAEAIALGRVADLSDANREALRALSLAVYPPGESTSWPGRQLQWAPAEWCVRVHDDAGALVSYVGIVLQQAQRDGRPVRVGGIGGVKTHPAARRRGLAKIAIERAIEFFREQGDIAFAVLVCGPHLIAYYEHLGWRQFSGRLLVQQRGETVEFTFNRVMTHPVHFAAPEAGTIDIPGPPW